MFYRLFLILFALSLLLFIACEEDSTTEPTPVVETEFDKAAELGDTYYTDYVNSSGSSPNIPIFDSGSNTGLYPLLVDGDATNDPVMFDFRSAADFDSCHIDGAINITLGDLLTEIDSRGISKTDHIVNICYTGQNSSVATSVLNLLGYNAQSLLFGMCGVDTSISGGDKWNTQIAADEYLPLNTTDKGAPTETFDFPTLNTGYETGEEIIEAQFNAGIGTWGVKFSEVIANKAQYFIVNYWTKDDYDNIGHIEDAYQFTPKESLQKDQMLKYLPTDKKIALYCWTGQTSAQVVAYLRMLGYDAYSIYYGVNGFAYSALSSHKYSPPLPGVYDSILIK